MDKCRYKTLLRDSAKLISNSQYANQNTAYIPLDVYTCYDVFYRPKITMSGASKLSQYNKYYFSGSPYDTQNMLPTGPTGDTSNSVWNISKSAATLEYYLPHNFASGYTGKLRSSVYKWDDAANGFVYPPVHQRIFGTFPQSVNLGCSATTTSSTYSVFFSISGNADGPGLSPSFLSKPSFYWWGNDITRAHGSGGHLAPIWDGFYTAGTLSNYLSRVAITTGGTIQSFGTTGNTFYFDGFKDATTGILAYNAKFKTANKNGHVIPIPNPTTGALNTLNEGVTNNAGYWEKDQCYMSGMTFDFAIGAGNGWLSGGPKFISATTPYSGYYTGFATGNVYVYSACCQHKVVDVVPPSELTSQRGTNSAENSNDYLVKSSFVYSGDGTTASCYLTSGLTYDTLIDNPEDKGYEGLVSTIYKNNLNYSGNDYTFIVVTDPATPYLLEPQNTITPYDATSLGIDSGMTNSGMAYNTSNKIELVVEDLPVITSGQSEYYLSQEPVGDVSLTLNGVVLLKDVEYIKDQRKVSIMVDRTVSNSVDVKTSDRIVVTYVKGSTIDGFVSETETAPTTIVSGGTLIGNNYNTFNYNTASTSYEYYTNQDIIKSTDLSNTVVLLNGVRLIPNKEYYKSATNYKRIIFNEDIRLVAGDIANIFYITNLKGMNSQSLTNPYKSITWSVTPTPRTTSGYFEIQVTNSADTKFNVAKTWTTIGYKENMSEYNTSIGPFDILNQRYLYRIINHKTYVSVSGSTLTTTAASLTNKFDTFNASLKSY